MFNEDGEFNRLDREAQMEREAEDQMERDLLPDDDDDPFHGDDAAADADVLRMAGMGTSEDYGHYGDDTPLGDFYGGE